MKIHETLVNNTVPPLRMTVIDTTDKVSHVHIAYEMGRQISHLGFSYNERRFIIKHSENETQIEFQKDVKGGVNTIERYEVTTTQNNNTVNIFVRVFFYTGRIVHEGSGQ